MESYLFYMATFFIVYNMIPEGNNCVTDNTAKVTEDAGTENNTLVQDTSSSMLSILNFLALQMQIETAIGPLLLMNEFSN